MVIKDIFSWGLECMATVHKNAIAPFRGRCRFVQNWKHYFFFSPNENQFPELSLKTASVL